MAQSAPRWDLGLIRERARRSAALQARDTEQHPSTKAAPSTTAPTRRDAAVSCGWCGRRITPKARGRIPRWCSAACRHRAWEQKRAAESGLAAVRVVEREVPGPKPHHEQWVGLLDELVRQLNRGEVYDRDLAALAPTVARLALAVQRREDQRRR